MNASRDNTHPFTLTVGEVLADDVECRRAGASLETQLEEAQRDTTAPAPLGLDLALYAIDVRRIFRKHFVHRCHGAGLEPDEVLQEVYLKILRANQGKHPYDPARSSRGRYIYLCCQSVARNMRQALILRNSREQIGGRADIGSDSTGEARARGQDGGDGVWVCTDASSFVERRAGDSYGPVRGDLWDDLVADIGRDLPERDREALYAAAGDWDVARLAALWDVKPWRASQALTIARRRLDEGLRECLVDCELDLLHDG